MGRRRFRWWHGMILGALVGVAAWHALALVDGSRVPTKASGLSLRDFAQLVARPAGATPDESSRFGAATLTDVRVHPIADGKQLVTATLGGDRYEIANGPIEFVAAAPFVYQPPRPRVAPQPVSAIDAAARLLGRKPSLPAVALPPAETFASVRDFLARHAPSLPVTYAWWEDPRLQTSAALGVPFALLGVLLPFALQCLVWLGLLAPLPPPAPKPVPAAPEPPAKPKVSVDDLVFANAQLDALTDGMAQQLAARADDDEAPAAAAPTTASFEPQASSRPASPLEPVVSEAPHDPTSYEAGVYYPVHRPKRGDA